MRAAAKIEEFLSHLKCFTLLGMIERNVHLHALGLGCHVGHQRLHVSRGARTAEYSPRHIRAGEPLQIHHAMNQARLKVIDTISILEVFRQARIGTLDDTGSKSHVAFLKGDFIRSAQLLPEILSLGFPQLRGIAILKGIPILLDRLGGIVLSQGRSTA